MDYSVGLQLKPLLLENTFFFWGGVGEQAGAYLVLYIYSRAHTHTHADTHIMNALRCWS
jgi:hypothetical protein